VKEIQLTKGYVAIIDDDDFERVSSRKWCTNITSGGAYAINGAGESRVSLHRFIMGLHRGDARIVDHINRNTMDNRKANLRVCTNSQNGMNSGPRQDSASKYKGVQICGAGWQASITKEGVKHSSQVFTNEVLAAIHYNQQAKKLFGQFAVLNSIQRQEHICSLLDLVTHYETQIEQARQLILDLCELEMTDGPAKAVA
jgi:hypothetical protein